MSLLSSLKQALIMRFQHAGGFENIFIVHFQMQFCNEYSVPKDNMENFKDVTAQDIVCSQVH